MDEFEVQGIKTTIGFHKRVLKHPLFAGGRFDTHLVEKMQEESDAKRVPEGHLAPAKR
jgi:acetyl-CoA carboxylase biotin carboxylase subunit